MGRDLKGTDSIQSGLIEQPVPSLAAVIGRLGGIRVMSYLANANISDIPSHVKADLPVVYLLQTTEPQVYVIGACHRPQERIKGLGFTCLKTWSVGNPYQVAGSLHHLYCEQNLGGELFRLRQLDVDTLLDLDEDRISQFGSY
jgi:hypothetical protein